MQKLKKIAITIGLIVLLLIGLVLTFSEPIKEAAVRIMGQQRFEKVTANQIQKNQHKKATYNFNEVKTLGDSEVAHAATNQNKVSTVGKLAIPSVKMYLPVMKGLSNDVLSTGAGTMKAKQTMGKGNYALAGHYMTNKGILFSPLRDVSVGDQVYLTDLKHVYTYQVTSKQVVNETDVSVINNVHGKKLVTLVTCSSATEGETNRIVVQGQLTAIKKATKQNLKVFEN
ncbi:sortase A [Lactobacillus selangorensis]|uniref:Sortase A n=1 Tax=Lactobacillus selangorensis TaxID=81857 RepID=A0A0R2FRR9_9LACO|nr:class A sortase [Lactobacillus selangorensis]KRN29061.1 sortase A [Lactobacillus selangorensis]KRN30026.1 sortase A [Lactobacillus selangorensis]